jgi:acetyl-CoA acyltransferase
MGLTAERVAKRYSVSREDADQFALDSHRKAIAAREAGNFEQEIVTVPVTTSSVNGKTKPDITTTEFRDDEGPRSDTTADALAKLPPVFHAKGTVTAGNSSQTSDGAAASVVMSDERANELGLRPLARFVAYAYAGCDPEEMGMGPVFAVPKALKLAGLTLDQIDVIELNEAFAAQSLAVIRQLGLDPAKVNVNGGAIALGHPLGASGARLCTTLLHEMERRGARYGLQTMCEGGGMANAMIIERVA